MLTGEDGEDGRLLTDQLCAVPFASAELKGSRASLHEFFSCRCCMWAELLPASCGLNSVGL